MIKMTQHLVAICSESKNVASVKLNYNILAKHPKHLQNIFNLKSVT